MKETLPCSNFFYKKKNHTLCNPLYTLNNSNLRQSFKKKSNQCKAASCARLNSIWRSEQHKQWYSSSLRSAADSKCYFHLQVFNEANLHSQYWPLPLTNPEKKVKKKKQLDWSGCEEEEELNCPHAPLGLSIPATSASGTQVDLWTWKPGASHGQHFLSVSSVKDRK